MMNGGIQRAINDRGDPTARRIVTNTPRVTDFRDRRARPQLEAFGR
jgi:hypothetical protein